MLHRAIDGRLVPGTYAANDELMALARAVKLAVVIYFKWHASMQKCQLTLIGWDAFERARYESHV